MNSSNYHSSDHTNYVFFCCLLCFFLDIFIVFLLKIIVDRFLFANRELSIVLTHTKITWFQPLPMPDSIGVYHFWCKICRNVLTTVFQSWKDDFAVFFRMSRAQITVQDGFLVNFTKISCCSISIRWIMKKTTYFLKRKILRKNIVFLIY